MTIAVQSSRNDYTGSLGVGPYPITFISDASTDIAVYVNRAQVTTGFTVTGTFPGTASVTFTTTWTAADAISFVRATPYTQAVDLVENDPLAAATIERAYDKLTILCQQVLELATRAIRFSAGSASAIAGIIFPELVANRFVRVNSTCDGFELVNLTAQGTLGVPVSVSDGGTSGTTQASARVGIGVSRMFIPEIAGSTTYAIATTDEGKTFVNNSGSVDQTYTLFATNGDATKGKWVRIVNTTSKTVTITPNGAESIFVGGSNLTSLTLTTQYAFVLLANTGGIGGPGWQVVLASPDVYKNLPEGFRPVHGNVGISAPIGAENPNIISLAPIHGGGLLVKTPTTNLWAFVPFNDPAVADSIEGDRSNCYVDGVAGQVLATNTAYYVGIKLVGGTYVMNFTLLANGITKTADTFVDVFTNDVYTSLVGVVYTLNNSFLFDPLNGRSVMSNWFPTSNQFGIMTPQVTVSGFTCTSYLKIGSGTLDLHVVTGPGKLFQITLFGYMTNTTAAATNSVEIKAINAAGGTEGTSGEVAGTIVTGGYYIPVSVTFAQPFGSGYYRFEAWGKTGAGSATFLLQHVALLLSA